MPRQSLYDPRTGYQMAEVLASRLPMLALALVQPTAESARETARMVAEKQSAFALGLLGAQQALARACLTGAWDYARITAEMAEAVEAPALRTLRSNARRLSRRRRS